MKPPFRSLVFNGQIVKADRPQMQTEVLPMHRVVQQQFLRRIPRPLMAFLDRASVPFRRKPAHCALQDGAQVWITPLLRNWQLALDIGLYRSYQHLSHAPSQMR